MADTLELSCTDPEAFLPVYNSVSAVEEGVTGSGFSSVKSAATVYLPKDASCGYYRLTDGRGYISIKQVKKKGWSVTSVPCSELRLQSLVGQCVQWMQTHLLYRPVRYNLPGPGPMELKADLPGVRRS